LEPVSTSQTVFVAIWISRMRGHALTRTVFFLPTFGIHSPATGKAS
jgi:hypothetical protein